MAVSASKPFDRSQPRVGRVWYLPLVATVAVHAVMVGGCSSELSLDKPEAKQNRPVLVQSVHFAPLEQVRTLVATIKPRIEADLGFRVTGKLQKRLVDVGATVKAGQVLAMLDENDLQLQLEQAQAEQRAASGSLETAVAENSRRVSLSKQGWTTIAAVEQQRAVVEEARGRLTKAERSLTLAHNALGYAKLVSDTDGVVTAVLAEPGQVLSAGQAAFRVARAGDREALAAIPETLVEKVRSGSVTISLWSNPDRVYRARLRELSPAADAGTRTFAARFTLLDAGAEAALGMTATVRIADPTGQSVARLPLSALFNQGSGPALWAADRASGALSLKPVHVVKIDGSSVYVSSGVAEGEAVVTLGVQKLDSGQKVRIVTSPGA